MDDQIKQAIPRITATKNPDIFRPAAELLKVVGGALPLPVTEPTAVIVVDEGAPAHIPTPAVQLTTFVVDSAAAPVVVADAVAAATSVDVK